MRTYWDREKKAKTRQSYTAPVHSADEGVGRPAYAGMPLLPQAPQRGCASLPQLPMATLQHQGSGSAPGCLDHYEVEMNEVNDKMILNIFLMGIMQKFEWDIRQKGHFQKKKL